MKEIASGVHMWSKLSVPHGYDFNGHLVLHRTGNLCIDPVEPTEAEFAEIVRLGVARILITNRNHSRAANEVKSRTGAPIAIHPADAPHARAQGLEIDEELRDGGKVGPFTVLGVPGKSPGEIALYWLERRLLVVGDAVIGHPPGQCGLLRPQVVDDPAALRQSVAQLLNLDFDTLLMGDGVPILREAKTRLRVLVESFSD